MSTPVPMKNLQSVRPPPPAKPLDEARWQAWLAKGRARDLRARNMRAVALKCAVIAVLLATALLSSRITPYEVVVRFVVAIGATAVMLQAFRERRYPWVIAFGALAVLFNPILPLLSFSADWQRAVVVVSAVLFGASLFWPGMRAAHHD